MEPCNVNVRLQPRYYSIIRIDGDGRAVTPTLSDNDSVRGPRQGYLRFSLDGSRVDTVMIPERKKGTNRWIVRDDKRIVFEALVPFQPRDIHTPRRARCFVTGWSGDYMLRLTRNGTDTVRLLGRTRPSEPVLRVGKISDRGGEDRRAEVDDGGNESARGDGGVCNPRHASRV